MTRLNSPRKRFGQHFLRDPVIIDQILDQVRGLPDLPLVEIGPGRGALTLPLLRLRGQLDAVEIDRDLAAYVQQQSQGLGDLRVHVCDVLRFDFAGLGFERFCVIGNLPYNISTPVLFHLLEYSTAIESMLFMLQREVVTRITAAPGNRDYGRLTVMIQAGCRVRHLFDIPPGAFSPAPAVTSSLVALAPFTPSAGTALVRDQAGFAEIVRLAFNQRRKTIRNSLKGVVDTAALIDLGLEPGMRAEELSVDDYIRLANYQHDIRPTPRKSCG